MVKLLIINKDSNLSGGTYFSGTVAQGVPPTVTTRSLTTFPRLIPLMVSTVPPLTGPPGGTIYKDKITKQNYL